jgi:hypothetical protein
VNIKEESSLRSTIFSVIKMEDNSIEDMCIKIKNLRRMPFHDVFVVLPFYFYDNLFKVLKKSGISIISFREDTNKTVILRVD